MYSELHVDTGLDNRTLAARKWKEYFQAYCRELGDDLTQGQEALCRRLATLEIALQKEESKEIKDPDYVSPNYQKLCGELSRALSKLNLLPGAPSEAAPDRDGLHHMSLECHRMRSHGGKEEVAAADKIDALMAEDKMDEADKEIWQPVRDKMYREEEEDQKPRRVRLVD